MAGSFFALFDDIATLLDDVSMMTKVAMRKTAGVLGDDLALNAQQVTGVAANRELPVVAAVAKGSLINKLILVPSALLISAFVPVAITPLLMLGGAYLCYEGFEKLAHKVMHGRDVKRIEHEARQQALNNPSTDPVAYEKKKIRGAIRTDFILSAEIIAITLGAVAQATLVQQVLVMSGIALAVTIGVYALVGCIVKLDDLGLYLCRQHTAIARTAGRALISSAPYLMKTLSVVGTAAMFMVGGSILVHGIGPVHHLFEHWSVSLDTLAGAGPLLSLVAPSFLGAIFGIIAGGVVVALVTLVQKLRPAAS
ncbi:DUF808 domain-containing protein [Allopusillimonas ginsengisoli]|nr:DUF808 domain-containing protein [Allopusillimonas ginsengisoli]